MHANSMQAESKLASLSACRLGLRWGLTAGQTVEQAEAVRPSCAHIGANLAPLYEVYWMYLEWARRGGKVEGDG